MKLVGLRDVALKYSQKLGSWKRECENLLIFTTTNSEVIVWVQRCTFNQTITNCNRNVSQWSNICNRQCSKFRPGRVGDDKIWTGSIIIVEVWASSLHIQLSQGVRMVVSSYFANLNPKQNIWCGFSRLFRHKLTYPVVPKLMKKKLDYLNGPNLICRAQVLNLFSHVFLININSGYTDFGNFFIIYDNFC